LIETSSAIVVVRVVSALACGWCIELPGSHLRGSADRVLVHFSDLRVYVVPVERGHLHAGVEILQRRLRHLECLHGNGGHTSQVGLVALRLKNGLLSQLDAQLLLEFLNHSHEELLLVPALFHSRLHVNVDALLYSALVHAITCYLRVKFESFEGSLFQSLQLEVIEVLSLFCVLLLVDNPVLPGGEERPLALGGLPLHDEPREQVLLVGGLVERLLLLLLPLHVLLVQLLARQLLLVLHLVHALLQIRHVLQLYHVHVLHNALLKIYVHVLYVTSEIRQLQIMQLLIQRLR